MAEDQDERAWAAAATRELLRARRLYREYPGEDGAIETLADAYRDAVSAGLPPEHIEGLAGMSITEIKKITLVP